MPYLQDLIHKLVVGPWVRYLRFSLPCLALVLLVCGYNWRSFRNFATQEAMDAAQVARNVAEGKGYTTLFVRPLSVHLVEKRNEARSGAAVVGQPGDPAQLKGMHPDLATPPVYPILLAGWMKLYGLFPFTDSPENRLWSQDGRFWWHPHDFLIGLLNQGLLFATVVLTFFLTRRLFDAGVAWLGAAILFGSELLWRFIVSGLSTMLLLLIFVGLAWCVVLIEAEVREPKGGAGRLVVLADGYKKISLIVLILTFFLVRLSFAEYGQLKLDRTVTTPTGNDRLLIYLIGASKDGIGYDYHSLVWEKKSSGVWKTHRTITTEELEAYSKHRIWIEDAYNLEPETGFAIIKGRRISGDFRWFHY